jgi:hypothetical protein
LDSVSLFGGDNKIPTDIGSDTQIPLYTYAPFDSGSLRMAEYGDMLYIMTAHTNYNSPSGIHHQSSMILAVNTSDMRITDAGEPASHSFNQFILISGDKLVTLDHGDKNPRAFGMSMWNAPAGSEFIREGNIDVNIMKFAGANGALKTSASVGGLEVSDTSYLTAGNSIDQSSPIYDQLETRNIFVSATPIDNFSESETKIKWLTSYEENGEETVYNPHLVKIDGDRFLVMWTEGEDEQILYVEVNGQGDFQTPVNYMKGQLSDCKPIIADGSVVWYVTESHLIFPTFYGIKTDDITQTWSVSKKAESGPAYAFPYDFTTEDIYGNTITDETLGEKELFFVYYSGAMSWISYTIASNPKLSAYMWEPDETVVKEYGDKAFPELAATVEEYGDRVGFLTLLDEFEHTRPFAVETLQKESELFRQNPKSFPWVSFEAPELSVLRDQLHSINEIYTDPRWIIIDGKGNILEAQYSESIKEERGFDFYLDKHLYINANKK